jgi:hypothetical protein
MCDECRAGRGIIEEEVTTPTGIKKVKRYCFCPEAIKFRTGLTITIVTRGSKL